MSQAPLPREQFPVSDRYCYLDHAAIAAPPLVVAHAVARDASAATMLGSVGAPRRAERADEVRDACAALMGVPADHLTFTKTSAEALRLLAFGLRLAPGDRVALSEAEHPGTAHPWLALAALGVEVDAVAATTAGHALDLAALAATLERGAGRVKVVVVSWVHYARGGRTDLAEVTALAHRHGALVVADVVQGLGVLPATLLDWGVDAAVSDGHSWLLGPEGIGLLYLSAELRSGLWAPPRDAAPDTDPGPEPVPDDGHPSPRFEVGSPNRHGIAGLGAAVELLNGAGIEAIWRHVDAWCDELSTGLTELGGTVVSDRSPAGRSGIVAATFGDTDPATFTERLVTHGVIVSGRGDVVRFAPHGWNDDDDLAATLRAVRRAWRR